MITPDEPDHNDDLAQRIRDALPDDHPLKNEPGRYPDDEQLPDEENPEVPYDELED